LRTVYLGTSEFAAAVLERLAASAHRPALVLSRPDRPRGRGRRLTAPPVAQTAAALGIELAQPQRVNDPEVAELIERVAGREGAGRDGSPAPTGSDRVVLVVCAFGALIKEPLLSGYPLLNVHPSLLPRWRGAAPIERAIMAGDARTGVSIMRLTEGLDSGPVCATASEAIGPQDTYGSLATRLQRTGGELLVEVLDGWERGQPPRFVEQSEEGASYAEKLGAEDRLLDPARPAVELERKVRALSPHIGARLALADGTLLGVVRAALADGTLFGVTGAALTDRTPPGVTGAASAASGSPDPGTEALAVGRFAGSGSPDPGTEAPAVGRVAASEGRLLLGTGAGVLELLEVQPPGGRPMDGASYLRGHGLPQA
jgi:methionyl-tRNA formyltransferase